MLVCFPYHCFPFIILAFMMRMLSHTAIRNESIRRNHCSGRDLGRVEQYKQQFPKVYFIQSNAGDAKDNLRLIELAYYIVKRPGYSVYH
jgi:hypothetical protein